MKIEIGAYIHETNHQTYSILEPNTKVTLSRVLRMGTGEAVSQVTRCQQLSKQPHWFRSIYRYLNLKLLVF